MDWPSPPWNSTSHQHPVPYRALAVLQWMFNLIVPKYPLILSFLLCCSGCSQTVKPCWACKASTSGSVRTAGRTRWSSSQATPRLNCCTILPRHSRSLHLDLSRAPLYILMVLNILTQYPSTPFFQVTRQLKLSLSLCVCVCVFLPLSPSLVSLCMCVCVCACVCLCICV